MMMESLAEIFKDESQEILAELESSLLELDDSPDDQDVIGRVFRSLHTIKGSGAMAGFTDISAFAHEVETVFDDVRSGRMTVTPELINLTLAARDQIKEMIDAHCGGATFDAGETERIIADLRLLGSDSNCNSSLTPPVVLANQAIPGPKDVPVLTLPVSADDEPFGLVTYRIRFHLSPEIFSHGINPVALLRELERLGECRVVAQVEMIPMIDSLDPERCYLSWDVILTTDKGRNAIEDVFIFVIDDCRLQIDLIDASWLENEDYKRLGEILVERGDISMDDLLAALSSRKQIGEILVEKKLVTPGMVEAALVEQNQVQVQRENRKNAEAVSSIRVKSEKLDILVNLIGELVTVQARLSQISDKEQTPEILAVAEEVERLTWELRDQVLTIRMLPIGATFSKFKRLVHDLSRELGKGVQLVAEGAETELDKTVIERLNDPLVHLIRNCIDHGIEAPEVRKANGKPQIGTIHLSASHVGANVILKVRDDGAGIDKTAVRRKVEEAGLVAPGVEISERELYQHILSPGFSTAKTITEVSGRGVGMDVVRQAVDALRGDLDISSASGQGTTFTIKLPLTLAIIDGLLVRVGCDAFVMPLAVVEECIELTRHDVDKAAGRSIVNVRSEIVPYVRLRDQFQVRSEAPEIEQVVIADVDGYRLGFVVDEVVGQHQTVIKNLGKMYKGVRGISGATILGDGRVALILDLQALREVATSAEQRRVSQLN